MTQDPRPAARIVDKKAGRAKVEREGRCRGCGGNRRLNRAHIVPKGQRGDDVDANLIPLCGSGTSGCHGAMTDHHHATEPSLLKGAHWLLVAARVRESLTSEERSYVVEKKGALWLERVYPK